MLDELKIEEKQNTPNVILNASNGVIDISGKSHPENALKFYTPVLQWIDEYLNAPRPETQINLNFIYFNTASSKMILSVLERFVNSDKTKVVINWHYLQDDEDMRDEGIYFSNITKLLFNFIEIT